MNVDSIMYPSDDQWEQIHSIELRFGDCWKNCDSYCCKSNHETQEFALFKQDSAGMIFMQQEYEFLERYNRLQTGFVESSRKHSFQFDDNKYLNFVTAVCGLGGLCSLPSYRPMICKLYPYLPIPSIESNTIEKFITGSALDQYWDDMNVEHPCWLHRTKEQEVKNSISDAGSKFQHPYIVFYLSAAGIFLDSIRMNLKKQYPELLSGDPRQFFKQWEVLYLTGQLIDKEDYRAELRRLYAQVVDQYGEFKL